MCMLLRAGHLGSCSAYLEHKQAFKTTVITVLVWSLSDDWIVSLYVEMGMRHDIAPFNCTLQEYWSQALYSLTLSSSLSLYIHHDEHWNPQAFNPAVYVIKMFRDLWAQDVWIPGVSGRHYI